MKKKVIRLTEGDLRRIVRNAVRDCLNEGQGWDAVKDAWRRRGDWMYYDSTYSDKDRKEDDRVLKNFVANGGITSDDDGHVYNTRYHESDPINGEYSLDSGRDKGYKPVNNSWRGKVGRRAAAIALKGMRKYGQLRNRFHRPSDSE